MEGLQKRLEALEQQTEQLKHHTQARNAGLNTSKQFRHCENGPAAGPEKKKSDCQTEEVVLDGATADALDTAEPFEDPTAPYLCVVAGVT
jgi:hypothetical protein